MNPGFESFVANFLTVGARISALMVFAPFFGSLTIAPRIKAGLALILTAVLYPIVGPELPSPSAMSGWKVAGGEVVLGLILGLVVQFVFEGMNVAGQVVGFQVGHSLANLINPLSDADTSILSNFYQSLALLIFLQLNIHHWLLRGLVKSFEYCPPGTLEISPRATDVMWRAAGGMLLIGIQIAIPTLLATMLIDISLGYLGKASPQLPVLFMGISAKSIAAFLVVIGTLKYWPVLLERYFAQALTTTEHLMRLTR